MSRRRLVVTASAVALLVVGLLVLAVAVGVTQTAYGRGWVRRLIVAQLAPRLHGKLYVGEIRGGFVTGATIDSIEIRGPDDSLFVASGRVTVTWDPRDLIDKRLLLRSVQVEHPFVHIRKYENGEWNFRRIFPPGPKKPPSTERGFGDFIVIDTATVHRAALFLTMPWHPADSLRGAKLDSAIAFTLTRRDVDVHETADRAVARERHPAHARSFARTWKWTSGELASSYVRIADPDSTGRLFVLDKLNIAESDPPFRFSNVHGTVRMLGDSLWLDLPHWDTPASTGSARGKVTWGSDLPVRYAIHVVGDSVSLNDVAWVYPTLPRTGGGRMVLDIRNQRGNLSVIDYAISKMDVRTTKSRLRGGMTFGVGGPVLIVKDVAVEGAPLDFELIKALNGKPFPYDWAGQLTGTVRARGGPVNRFVVDDAQFTFHDAHVPGAITRGSGRGGLDILFPAFTAFRGFQVDVAQLDLRTIEFLNPNFPRLGGLVSGRATLDSSWLDVRFSSADLTHRDGSAEPSRFTGAGRVTFGDEFMTYDLDLAAEALSFPALARSYPTLPLRGVYQGPMRVQGTIADLDLTTTLTGPAGTMAVDGHFDLYPAGYAARGRGSLAGFDVRTLLTDSAALAMGVPTTTLNTQFEMDLAGDSLPNLTGTLALDVDRSVVDSVRVYSARTRLGFASGVVRVDTLIAESAAGNVAASGGLGLAAGRSDSLSYVLTIDSLGGLRRYLAPSGAAPPDSAAAGAVAVAAADSLAGGITVRGTAAGWLGDLAVAGTVRGRDVVSGTASAHVVNGSYAITGLPDAPSGRAALDVDTVRVGGLRLTHTAAEVTVEDRESGRFVAEAEGANGARFALGGAARFVGDSASVLFDSAAVTLGDHVWRLAAPALVESSPDGLSVDTLLLRGSGGGWLAVAGTLPEAAPVRFSVRGDSVPLADVGLLAQTDAPLEGTAAVDWTVSGARADPTMELRGAVVGGRFGDVRLERVTIGGRYDDRRFEATMNVFRDGRSALGAQLSLPVDLALVPVAERLLDEPLRGSVRADSVDLGLVEALTTNVQRATGTLEMDVDIGGTWSKPTLDGSVTVADGAMTLPNVGIRLQRLTADVRLTQDSVTIDRISATTGGRRQGSILLRGAVDLSDQEDPGFDLTLTANYFHAVSKGGVGDLYVSTSGPQGLHLVGSARRSRLTGSVFVPAGEIYIPELTGKKVVGLDDPEFYSVIDTSLYTNRTLLPDAPPMVVQNLSIDNVRIRMGDDVWLRSSEANINLGGDVGVTVGRDPSDSTQRLLALDGTLLALRGTYRLNLGLALQRTFEVETGTLQFFGEPDLNPTLDISAIHTVRQAGQQDRDVPIRVTISGTLAQPRLTLSSADPDLLLSESDAISYLITGQPSFLVFGDRQEYTSQAASVILPSLGSYFGDKVASALGLDVVQIETSGVSTGQTLDLRSTLASTRLGGGVQIGSRTFLRANVGLCQVGQLFGGNGGSSSSSTGAGGIDYSGLIGSIGAKVEYRLSRNYSASVGLEPSTSRLVCQVSGAAAPTFIPTPPQLGLDLTRRWEF